MTKLTTERLDKLQDNLLQFQDSYSDPADKENYDIFVDALHMLDEFKAAKEKILAYEQAAKNPVAWTDSDELKDANKGYSAYLFALDGEANKYADPRRKIMLYAAPVLPKQPELMSIGEILHRLEEQTGEKWVEESAQPVMAEQWRSFVTDADIAALHRFVECCDDPESGGHDLEKEQVQRLEKVGALQRSGRISYITDFGDYLISATAPINAQQNEPQNIPAPLELRYGDNVLLFLNELASFDASDIDSDGFDVYGEDRNGTEGCATISITELAADAAKLLSAQPVSELRARAIALYKPPFKFDHGYIWDADGRMVADNNLDEDGQILRVRGWGRISYLENAEALQDEVGEIIAIALSNYWSIHSAAAPAQESE